MLTPWPASQQLERNANRYCSDPYGEGAVTVLKLPDYAEIAMQITKAGIGTLPEDVGLYVGEFWK